MGDLVKSARKIGLVSVGQMSPMGKIHRQNAISRLQHAEVNRHIRLAAAVRLHIDVFRSEKLLGPVNRQLFRHVDEFATSVPAAPRIAFRVLVGQDRALRLHHRSAGKIFGSDQFDVLKLPFPFVLDGLKDSGIDLF